jgi:polyhydroxybutyrate depolymerase
MARLLLASLVIFAVLVSAPADASVPRPFTVRVPHGHDASKKMPLYIVLHGWGSSGERTAKWLGIEALADRKGFLVAAPNGAIGARGRRYWNASDACCRFGSAAVDDVAFVGSIIDAATSQYNVDTKRIFVIGHSNGGFMAHKLACALGSRIAGIVSLAGAATNDTHCESPVAILEVHGTDDSVIRPGGGRLFDMQVAQYSSMEDTVAAWARRNGCTAPLSPTGRTLDLVPNVAGAETRVEAYGGCAAPVELWRMVGAVHRPQLGPSFADAVHAFLVAHPKS